MEALTRYTERIRQYFPDLVIEQVEVNSDGLMNDVLIVNRERVFRFAKDAEWIRECLRKEARILDLVRERVDMPVPVFDVQDADCVSYRLLPGQGLRRADILRQAEETQDALARQLAVFLRQLRSIPQDLLDQHDVPPTNATQTRADYMQLLEDLEREVLPLPIRTFVASSGSTSSRCWRDG